MPFLLLDDATDEAKRRLQDFGQQQLQNLTAAGQTVQPGPMVVPPGQAAQHIQQAPQQVQGGLQDITARLQDFGQQQVQGAIQTLQPLQAAQQQKQQDTQNALGRLQTFGSDQLTNLTKAAQPVTQTFTNQFGGGQPQGQPDQVQVQPGGDLQAYARQAAQKAGIDPDVFVRQIQQESGFNPTAKSPAGALGIAQFMPGTAQGMNVDPTDPYAALDAAARLDAQNLQKYGGSWDKALAAYNAGGGAVDQYGGVPPYKETQSYVDTILQGGKNVLNQARQAVGGAVQGAQQAVSSALPAISQFGDKQLTAAEAYAACGPAAAVRFAALTGRQPTLREATDLARQVGWTADQGMAGLGSESALFDKMQIPHRTVGADWHALATEAASGNPVVISTPGHYFTADGYNAQSGAFHVGSSGTDLKAGGEWMTPAQMEGAMGRLQGGLAVDNPQVPGTSPLTRGTAPSTPGVSSPQDLVGQGIQKLQDITAAATAAVPPGQVFRRAGQGLEALGGQLPDIGPVPGSVVKAAGQALQAPSQLESMQTLQDLNAKYAAQAPSAKGGFQAPVDPSVMTPEDRQAYTSAMAAVGMVVGAPLNVNVEGGLNYPGAVGWASRDSSQVRPIGTPGEPMYHITGGARDYTAGMRPVGNRGYRYFGDSTANANQGFMGHVQTQTGPRALVVDPAQDIQIAQDVFGGPTAPGATNEPYSGAHLHADEMPADQYDAIRARFRQAVMDTRTDPSLNGSDAPVSAGEVEGAIYKLEDMMLDHRHPVFNSSDNTYSFARDPKIPSWGTVENRDFQAALDKLGIDAIRVSDEAGISLAVRNLNKVSIRQPNVGTTETQGRNQVFYSGRGTPMTEGDQAGYGYNPSFDPGTSTLGRGYFMTDRPEVAGGIVNEQGQVEQRGYAQNKAVVPGAAPNVRKILVPELADQPEMRQQYTSGIPALGPSHFMDTPHGQAMYQHFNDAQDAVKAFQDAHPGEQIPAELNQNLSDAASIYLANNDRFKADGTLPDYTDTLEYRNLNKQRQDVYDQYLTASGNERSSLSQQLDAIDHQIGENDRNWNLQQVTARRAAVPAGMRPTYPPSGKFHVFQTDEPITRTDVGAVLNAEAQRVQQGADAAHARGAPDEVPSQELYGKIHDFMANDGNFYGQPQMQGLDFWHWLGDQMLPGASDQEQAIAVNKLLSEAGYDGILYKGGTRKPMIDENGDPITHRALMVFPESADRVTNALTFRSRGEADPRYAAALGLGAAGAGVAAAALGSNGSVRDQAGSFVSPVTNAIGGALDTAAGNLGLRPRTADEQAQLSAGQARMDASGARYEPIGLESLLPGGGGPSAIGPTSPGDELERQINEAIAQGNPLRDVPVAGPVSTWLGQQVLNPTNLTLMGEGLLRAPGPALESLLRDPSVARFVTDESGSINYGRLADLLRSRTGPSEGPLPHGMAVPETGYQAGTPEYAAESALRQAAADQGTHRPNLTQAEIQALPGMAGSHLSDLNELREAVQTGLPAMRWYTEMAKQIATDTGQNINPREAAVLMGATAGNAGVPPNYHSMLSVFRAMRLASPDLTGFENLNNKAIQDTQAFQDVAARIKELATYLKPYDLARIMQGYRTGEIPYPSGAKLSSYTTNFLHALSDLYDPYTTQDVWQGRLMGSRLVPDPANPNKLIESVASPTITNDPTYRTAHALTNWIARELNINPREAQAAGWGVIRSLWNDDTIGPQLQTGQITLRDALRQGMQQGMFDPRQLQAGMLSDVLGGTGTKWDAKIAQARDLIRSEGLYDTPPPPSATGVESMSSIHPADWNAATGLNKADIPRPVSEPLATGLADIARVTAPVIRVPGTLEGNTIPDLLLEHSIQRAGDNSYVHLVGAGDAAAQDVASRIGGDLISHYDPVSTDPGGFIVRGLGADEQNALARQLRMNGVPVVEGRGPGLSVPLFGDENRSDILGTIRAGVESLGPEAAADISGYTGSVHPVGLAGLPGEGGYPAGAAGRPDLPVWASDQGAAQAPWWAAREPGLAYAPFAARLGGGALGGLAGYATTPPEASPQERAARTAAGVGVGLAAPFALSGNVGRVIQASRVGSLAGGLPTLVHIGLNLPVQTGLKLASDLPASVLSGHPEASASELYGVLQGLRAWGINASKTLGQPGPMASSMGGGVGPQVAEAGLTGLVRLHPLVQDMARQVATHMDLYKTAATEATNAGLTRFGSQWRAEVARLVNAPTSAMTESADAAGNRAALGGAIGSPGAAMGTTGTAVKRAINDSPLLRFILPIFDIGYHVAQQGLETSPLGVLGTGWDVVRGLTGAAGGGPYAGGNWAGRGATGAVTPLAERFRNNMIGMALAYEGYNQAEQGNITGEGPSDPGKQAELRSTGWQPDSIRIGGRYFNAHLLGPVGWSLIQGANTYEATHGVSGQGLEPVKTPQGERAPGALDIAGDLVARQGRYFNDETFLRSLGDVLNTVGSSHQAGQMATREAASIFESLIPQGALLANVASVQDPFQRNPRAAANPLEDIQNQLMSRLPGQREQLQPRVSATGRQLSNPQEGWGILAPRSSLIQGDPILEEMQSLGVTPTNVPKSISYGSANEVQLTPQEQYQWQVYRGQALSDGATQLMASAAYKKLGDVAQRNALAKVVSGSGTVADAKLRLELSKQPGFAGRMIGTGAGAPVYSYAPGGATVSPSLSDQLAAAGP